jgi:two-component sensor histidine kinase
LTLGLTHEKQLTLYAYALAIFALAVIARALIDFVVPGRLPFITFFPAVFLAAYYLGRVPLLVLVLSTLVGTAWADPTGESPIAFYIASALLFLVIAGMIVFFVDALKAAHEKLRRQDQQLEMVNRELKHRIKNLFAIADSVCQQTIRAGGSAKEMSRAVSGRILAIASAQDLLSTTATKGAELDELVQKLVSSVAPSPSRIRVEGEPFRLSVDTTTPFALILNELATNALKYGAWTRDNGWIHIQWTTNSELLRFRWREHDGPVLAPPVREGLGRKLIKSSLPGARVEHSFKPDGLECEIDLPLGQLPRRSSP